MIQAVQRAEKVNTNIISFIRITSSYVIFLFYGRIQQKCKAGYVSKTDNNITDDKLLVYEIGISE